MRRTFVALALGAMGLSACATSYSLSPVVGAAQSLRYDQGVATLESNKGQSAVRIAPTNTSFEGRIGLSVVALNLSNSNANLGSENVRVTTNAGTLVRVYTHEELVKEAKTAAAWAAVAVALSGAADAYAASQPTTVTTYGNVYGPSGYANYYGTTSVYSPARTAAANAAIQYRTNSQMGDISARLDATLGSLGDRILRTTTIAPNYAFGGQLVVAKPKFQKGEPPRVHVVVTFAGDVHEFHFDLAEG